MNCPMMVTAAFRNQWAIHQFPFCFDVRMPPPPISTYRHRGIGQVRRQLPSEAHGRFTNSQHHIYFALQGRKRTDALPVFSFCSNSSTSYVITSSWTRSPKSVSFQKRNLSQWRVDGTSEIIRGRAGILYETSSTLLQPTALLHHAS